MGGQAPGRGSSGDPDPGEAPFSRTEQTTVQRGGFQVRSVRPASGAAKIGFQTGDLVLAINGRPLADGEAFRRTVLGLQGRNRALVVVQRGNGRYHVTVPLS